MEIISEKQALCYNADLRANIGCGVVNFCK